MSLTIDTAVLERMTYRRRRKCEVLIHRAEHLHDRAMFRAQRGLPAHYDVQEYIATRWALWMLGVVIADTEDDRWTREHVSSASVDSCISHAVKKHAMDVQFNELNVERAQKEYTEDA